MARKAPIKVHLMSAMSPPGIVTTVTVLTTASVPCDHVVLVSRDNPATGPLVNTGTHRTDWSIRRKAWIFIRNKTSKTSCNYLAYMASSSTDEFLAGDSLQYLHFLPILADLLAVIPDHLVDEVHVVADLVPHPVVRVLE